MSERVTVTFPDEHYAWLLEVMKRRGWTNVQAAIRSLVEDLYRLEKKLGAKAIDAPVSVQASDALTTKQSDVGGLKESTA